MGHSVGKMLGQCIKCPDSLYCPSHIHKITYSDWFIILCTRPREKVFQNAILKGVKRE